MVPQLGGAVRRTSELPGLRRHYRSRPRNSDLLALAQSDASRMTRRKLEHGVCATRSEEKMPRRGVCPDGNGNLSFVEKDEIDRAAHEPGVYGRTPWDEEEQLAAADETSDPREQAEGDRYVSEVMHGAEAAARGGRRREVLTQRKVHEYRMTTSTV